MFLFLTVLEEVTIRDSSFSLSIDRVMNRPVVAQVCDYESPTEQICFRLHVSVVKRFKCTAFQHSLYLVIDASL